MSSVQASDDGGARSSSATKDETAPAPNDPRKPKTPTQVSKPSWKYIFKRTLREFSKDKCTDLAAALTYFAVLSMFPALLALVSLLGIVGQAQKTTQMMLDMASKFAPQSALDAIKEPIQQLTTTPTAGLALVVGILGAVWSASGYVGAFSRATNRIYEIDEGRPFWKLRPAMLGITVVLLLLAVAVSILLVISGPVAQTMGNVVGLGDTAVTVWEIAKWPVVVIFAIVMIAVLYYASPNVKQPRFRWISMGAVIALVVLGLASLGFAFYVGNFSNYNKTYGAIGGVIVLLLWLWIANNALLFGAEFDAETERGRELQAGIEAEESIQLPPRDDRGSNKLHEKEKKIVAQGRSLREEHDGPEQQNP